MSQNKITNEYFEWLSDLIQSKKRKSVSYRKLLVLLHNTEFTWGISNDGNRAEDGIDLRYRFALEMGYRNIHLYLKGPCSVLEMMVALAFRCEEHIMDDPDIGNRTSQWFFEMLESLNLIEMDDLHFDANYARDRITRFIERRYEPDGSGGLFTIRRCAYDLRNVEIWYQMCWYLDSIL